MILKLGCEDPQVVTIQELLKSLGFMYRKPDGSTESLVVDGTFGEKTEQTVMDFQKNQDLLVDGIVGPVTMKALQDAYARRMVETTAPTALSASLPYEHRMPLVRVEADKFADGYSGLFLRCDAAEGYNAVRKIVLERGGLITTSGGIRELSQSGGPNRSMVSFHYVGLAFDLCINSGMRDPAFDPYVVTLDPDQQDGARPYLRVWARCDPALVPECEVKNVITYKERRKPIPSMKGPFIDLTALFLEQGFARIRARPPFWTGVSELAAEWWHFQFEKPLVPRISTFGSELLRIYSRSQVENSGPWSQRDRIFKVDWS